MGRKYFLAANWKMNGDLDSNKNLILNLKNYFKNISDSVEIIVCPPSIYINQINNLLSTDKEFIRIGSQDISFENNGAYTGQISLSMLNDFDVSSVIIGHSERRIYNRENDIEIAAKVYKILAESETMTPILCVGESLQEREKGLTKNKIKEQLIAVFNFLKEKGILDNIKKMQRLVIAYEPIWAIGTGKVASSAEANEVNSYIRELIQKISLELSDKVRIIYGGSVKSSNALDLINQSDIDGFLVGGASLDAAEFVQIYSHMCN